MIIAIDGLGVNGKSTLAKRIAEKLNFKNFGAGAIYRCIALRMILVFHHQLARFLSWIV